MAAGASPSLTGLGDGLGEMLTTSLKSTGCFDIQEREEMDEIQQELARVGKKLAVQQADFMISGAVTGANFTTQRRSFGGGFIPVVEAITKKTQKADLNLDVRVIDINHAKVLDAKTVEANSENSAFGVTGVYGYGMPPMGGFGGQLTSLKGTAMEDVARDAIAQATAYIVDTLAQAKHVHVAQPVVQKQASTQ